MPRIIVVPHPRTIEETFDQAGWARLNELAEVIWGRDEPMPVEQFEVELLTSDAVAVGEWAYRVDDVLATAPRLKVIFEMMGTHDHPLLDYETCLARGVEVGSIAPVFGPVVAEFSLTLALAAARGVGRSDRRFRSGEEVYLHEGNVGSISLLGKTAGFVGCGSISRTLQSLLEPFEVEVLGYDPWLPRDEFTRRSIESVGLPELFRRSNVVFVLAVPTPANRGLVSDALMSLLSPTDVLVVTSRAHLVDFEALTRHLLAGDFRAGIDIFPGNEPLESKHPIRSADGVVLTAHLAGALPEALLEIGRLIVHDLEAILRGSPQRLMQYATPAIISSLRSNQ